METQSKLWYLENLNLFAGLSSEEMMEMSRKVVDTVSNKGQYIYFPKDPSNSLFFLKKGGVKIASVSEGGRETIQAILKPGEIFGELALAGSGEREDYAQAIEDETVICAISVKEMEELMAKHPVVTLKVTRMMGLRMKKLERKVRDLVFKDARSRIIDFIREMALENGKQVGDELLIRHVFTHQDIANLTASSRQVVTTVLNELRDQNLINFERKRILVRDIRKLK